jgi:hypothetical protein
MAFKTQRVLTRIQNSGFARAKKLADLAIKTNVDGSGRPTSAGYEQAISYLQPYIASGSETEAIDAQRLIAAYSNSFTKLDKKQKDQTETVAAFKLQEMDSYFTSFDGDVSSFRNPADLIDTTSEALDNLVLGVINAIDEKQANGDSTDALYSYLNDISKRADSLRNLRNKYEQGELTGQTLDGFGYYVDTNPLDGSIRAAALLPAGMAPDGLVNGYRRIEATANVGGALLPVYAPAQQDALGEYTVKIGDATWAGTGSGALQARDARTSKNLFAEGGFNISDPMTFPVRKNGIDKGAFGKGFIGRDKDGNPVESTFYRGADNKLYKVDQATIEQFKKDPILKSKLDGYVTQFSPTEIKELSREAVPFTGERLSFETKIAGLKEASRPANEEAERTSNLGFFGKVKEGLSGLFSGGGQPSEPQPESPKASFFGNTNRPNQPEEAPTGGSAENIIDTGNRFFRSQQ